jgi:hypothetical protein
MITVFAGERYLRQQQCTAKSLYCYGQYKSCSLHALAITAHRVPSTQQCYPLLISALDTSVTLVAIAAVAATGGLFIPFTSIPSYWSWLAELGVFTHSTKAALLYIFKELVYTCPQSPEVCD